MLKPIAYSVVLGMGLATGALAAGDAPHVENFAFSFQGPFGAYDESQLQRGLQVYTEVCAACHGLKYVPIRTLGDEGGPHLPEEQLYAYAEFYEVWDPELNDGEGDYRIARPSDTFPENNTVDAPDLSLMAKSRAGFHGPYGLGINQLLFGTGGPEYIASLLTGYKDPPSCAPDDMDGYYNTVFTAGGYPDECKDEDGKHLYPGSWINMAPPMFDGHLDYADGHANDLHHLSEDVSAFLMWTAEPKMMARKQAGFVGVLFLVVLSVLLYLTNKSLWMSVKKNRSGS